MKKYVIGLILTILCFSLTACNKNKIDIDENEVDLEYEMPDVQIIAKDIEHEIEVEEIPIETMAPKTRTLELDTEPEIETLLSIGIHNEISEEKVLTNEEKNEILRKVGSFKATNKESLNELILLIDENISSFDLRERDLMIKKYILSLYDIMNNLNSILGIIGYDLESVVKEYDIKVNDKTSIETIPNTYGTVKGFLLEVKDKGFFINSINKNKDFYIDLDLGNILNKYKNYISTSMISYIEFNNYEMNNTLSLTDTNTYNLEEIINRIQMLTDGLELDKKNNYMMVDKYVSSLTYYYQLLLGLSHTQFIDTKTENFNLEILDKYKKLQNSYPDTIISDVLEKTVLALEANDMIYTEELKSMVNDYLNSLIYTEEISNVINTDINTKYGLLIKEEIKEEEKTTEVLEENNK